jgi:hypothetical protein
MAKRRQATEGSPLREKRFGKVLLVLLRNRRPSEVDEPLGQLLKLFHSVFKFQKIGNVVGIELFFFAAYLKVQMGSRGPSR